MRHHGWHQIAFESDLDGDLTPAEIGTVRLMIVRTPDGIGVYDADCPHRAAHLGAGRLVDGAVVCPFHGYRIALGTAGAGCDHGFAIRRYETLVAAGAIFVRPGGGGGDTGFAQAMHEMLARFEVAGCFTLPVAAPAALVIENAFDAAHFPQVHDIARVLDCTAEATADGAVTATALFEVDAADRFQTGPDRLRVRLPYRCTAFSPGLVLSELGGHFPYATLTGATATKSGETVVRFTLALPPGARNGAYMIEKSREGVLRDAEIWQSIAADKPPLFTAQDAAVLAFRHFCTTHAIGDAA